MENCYLTGRRLQFCEMRRFWRSVTQKVCISHHVSTVRLIMVEMVNFTLCIFLPPKCKYIPTVYGFVLAVKIFEKIFIT